MMQSEWVISWECVRAGTKLSAWFPAGMGMRHGCVLFPRALPVWMEWSGRRARGFRVKCWICLEPMVELTVVPVAFIGWHGIGGSQQAVSASWLQLHEGKREVMRCPSSDDMIVISVRPNEERLSSPKSGLARGQIQKT